MEVKAGYQQTEVGVIPNDWNAIALKDCTSKITDGTHDTPKPVRSGVPFLTAIHVKDNWIDFDGCLYVTEAEHKIIYARCNPEKNDVLLVNIGAGVATTALVTVDYEFSLKNVALIKPDAKKSDGAYLNYALALRKSKIIQDLSSGGAQPFLSLSQIGNITIPIPPKTTEQEAIAEALSDVDALIEALAQLIAKKHRVKQGAMQELLTGKRRLPGFGGEWETKTLASVCNFINDGTHFTPKYVDNGIPFYSVENVTANDFTNIKFISPQEHNLLIKRCKPEKGDILMTRIGALGVTKLIDWDVNASIYVSLALLKVNKQAIDEKYLYCYTKSRKFIKDLEARSLVNAAPQKINMAEIGGVPILVPPLAEQTAIAEILSDMDAEIAALEGKLSKARQVKQGMMQELLTGRIRLL